MAGSPSMSSRPQWRDLQRLAASLLAWWVLGDVGAALRRSFGFAQDDKVRGSGWQGLPVCHPDRSGGISSGWQRALVWWLLGDAGAASRRSFGFAQDDRVRGSE